MRLKQTIFFLISSACLGANHVQASVIDQYATSVIGFSSQWSGTGWSAAQVLGASDTFDYGDIPTSWAPLARDGTSEYIAVGFDTPVYATGATVRETYGNGFVSQIDVIDTNSIYHTIWSGNDPSLPGAPVDFFVNWATTGYLVSGLKIYTNTDVNLAAWEEIDSVQLHGDTVAPVPLPASGTLLVSGLIGLLGMRKKAFRNIET